MRSCPVCGSPVGAGATSCPACGRHLDLGGSSAGATLPYTSAAGLPPLSSAAPAVSAAGAYSWSHGMDASSLGSQAGVRQGDYSADIPTRARDVIRFQHGESILREAWFSPKILFPHLQTLVLLTDQRVVIRHPHTIFGMIPLGYWETSAKLSAVSTIGAGTRVRTERLLMGAVGVLFGAFQLFSSFGYYGAGAWGLLMALVIFGVSAYLLVSARVTGLIVFSDGESFAAAARGSELPRVEQTAYDLTQTMLTLEDQAPRRRS